MSLQKTQVIFYSRANRRGTHGKWKNCCLADCYTQVMTFSPFVKRYYVLVPGNGIIKSVDACSKYMSSVNSSLGG